MVNDTTGRLPALLLVVALLLAGCGAAPRGASDLAAASTIDRFEITARKPAFAGARFGDAGEYEAVAAVAHVSVDPRHTANRRIADLEAAAGPDGLVRYKTDVLILRPRDAAKAARVLVADIPNRGRKLLLQIVNDGDLQADSAAQAGTGWAMRQGYTLVWVGWQGDIALSATGQTLGMTLPSATDRGTPIIGTSIEEAIFDADAASGTIRLSYPAATLEPSRAELSVRTKPGAPATIVPPEAWRFKSASEVEFRRVATFDAGAIHQFRYDARDPKPMGLGMAATRDIVAFLKAPGTDATGMPHPLSDIRHDTTVALGISQSGRFLRDFVWQGFNASPAGGRVFDGMLVTIAGSRKTFTNVRWAQPGRYSRQHEDHWFYGDQFPFTYGTITDPLTGRRDGIFERCRSDRACPKLMHLDSSLEFWQGRSSLVVTDGAGRDVALPDDVRAYLMASTQHVAAATPVAGICVLPNNPARQSSTYRALTTRLIAWVRDGQAPPPSRFPSIGAGTLVAPQRAAMGFPDLSALGLALPAAPNELNPADHSTIPPLIDTARRYEVLVPRTDADGHDLAGIRVPEIEVPLATHTGFGSRRAGFAEGQLCGLNGSYLPFAPDARERIAKGDPRLSIAERYATRTAYLQKLRAAAERLKAEGLMLDEDVARTLEAAAKDPRLQALPP